MSMIASRQIPETDSKNDNSKKFEIKVPIYWDERDHYTQKQWKTLEEIDAQIFGQEIYITELDTVIIRVPDHDDKEILFDDYIKDLEEKVNKEECSVKYDKESNKFYLVQKEDRYYAAKVEACELKVSEKTMNDYVFGVYTNVTSKLNELYLKSLSIEERQNLLAKKEADLKKIEEKTNITHELLTPVEARMYLDYLEDLERTNAKIIKDNTISIIGTTTIPIVSGVGLGFLDSILGSTSAYGPIFCAISGTFIAATCADIYLEKVKGEPFSNVFGITVLDSALRKIKQNKEKKEENRLLQTKIKKLYELDDRLDKMVISNYSLEEFDKTLNEEELQSLNLQNSVLNNIDGLVNRINLLNANDKKIFLNEAIDMLTEYTERYTNILNQDSLTIDLEADNFELLKRQTLEKIVDLESRITEVRQKDVQIKQVTDESRLLTDKIEGFTEFNNLDEDILRTKELANKKVKVKTLKENKKSS